MKRFLSIACKSCFMAAWSVIFFGCGGPGIGLDAAPMPDASLVGKIDPQAIRATPFWDAAAELVARQMTGMDVRNLEQFVFLREVMENSDLALDDLLEIRLAAQVQGGEGREVQAVTGFRFGRPLSPDSAVQALESIAARYGTAVTIGEVEHQAGTVLRVEVPDGERSRQVWFGFAERETVVFQGTESAVLGAMDRIDSGTAAEMPAELARVTASIGPEVQGWLAYTVSERQRETISGLLGLEDIPAPLSGLAGSLLTFTSGLTEVQVAENLKLRVHWFFEGPQEAEAFYGSITGLTELAKGVVALASGGRPIDAVNDMSLAGTDRSVYLDLSVSQNDLLTLEELYELNFTE
jgi:hypothetical protein